MDKNLIRRKTAVHLAGGLGNQLFQYATGLALTKNARSTLVLRTHLLASKEDAIGGIIRRRFSLEQFDHGAKLELVSGQPYGRTSLRAKLEWLEQRIGAWFPRVPLLWGTAVPEIFHTKLPVERLARARRLVGHLPIFEIILPLRSELSQRINSLSTPSENFLDLATTFDQNATTAVHLRFGDFVGLHDLYGEPNPEKIRFYVTESIKRESEVTIFSDSPERAVDFCKQHNVPAARFLGPDSGLTDLETLILMSRAKHLICANSTMSWWAAFLSESAQIYYPQPSQAKYKAFPLEGVLKNWISMGD